MSLTILKEFLRLSSPLTLVLVFGAAVAWLMARPLSRAPRRALLGLVLGYWLVSSPLGAGLLVAGLSRGLRPLQSREAALGADTVVVLGGGAQTYREAGAVAGALTQASIMRALEGARVSRLVDAKLVIVSGGLSRDGLLKPESRMLRDTLVGAGVPADRIVEESSSKTTRDQARIIAALFEASGVKRFVLVTSPTHMRRALAAFRATGLNPVPSTAPLTSDTAVPAPLLMPNDFSLSVSDQAVYDYAAGLYYWLKGWTRPGATG